MKSKTKTKLKTNKNPRTRRQKVKAYPAHYLAIVLAVILLFEGWLFGSSTASDWQNAIVILDVSEQVNETQSDLIEFFQPMFQTAEDVNQFYQLSATTMIELVDLSSSGFGSEVEFVYDGVSNFYALASEQMAIVLDVSETPVLHGGVAGITLENY